MTTFAYRAYTTDGASSTGTIDASSENEAKRMLSNNGLLVAHIGTKRRSLKEMEFGGGGRRKIRQKDVAWLARTLASTESAGLPVFSALGLAARQQTKTALGSVVSDIRDQVADGASLGTSFRSHEKELGTLTCALVEVGEHSGTLGQSFEQIAHVTEAQVRLKRQLKSATVYPAAVLVLAVGMIVAMLIWVVPTFDQLYADSGAKLPFLTRMLVNASNGLKDSIILLVLLGIIAFVGYRYVRTRPAFVDWRDRTVLRMPLIGELVRKVNVARVASALAAMLRAGEGMLESIELGATSAGNVQVKQAMYRVRDAVAGGMTLSAAFRTEPIFGEMLPGLVQVGEESGSVDEMLTRFAKIAEEEAEAVVQTLTTLVEPALVVVLGGIIGVAVIGLYLPMFDIAQVVTQ